jgi:DNA polymerase-3 subunit gamma/tau
MDAASNTGVTTSARSSRRCATAAGVGPLQGYIIDEVHMLSRTPFNALLKTLEEPPRT